MEDAIVYEPGELLPDGWRSFLSPGPVRLFNPALLADGAGWLFAYRVVGPDLLRRIGICRLDARFRPVAGSAVALTDLVRFAPRADYGERVHTWFADPRLVRLGGRLFLYWNSGWHDPQNHQFLQELEDASLRPLGPPRELLLAGLARRKLEKNWTFFGSGPFYGIYSVHPHRVLAFDLAGEGDITCTVVAQTPWDDQGYEARYGELRGGAPPQLSGGHYTSFCHSVHPTPAGYRYAPAVYRFSATFPFAPTEGPTAPLALPNPFGTRTVHERLNPVVGEVIYPCGAARCAGGWVISYGLNDEHCAVGVVPERNTMSVFRPVALVQGDST